MRMTPLAIAVLVVVIIISCKKINDYKEVIIELKDYAIHKIKKNK